MSGKEEAGNEEAGNEEAGNEEAGMGINWRSIGTQLKERRKSLDLSVSDAAHRASISKDLWEDIEAGGLEHLSDETLVRIARGLDLDPAGFLDRCGRHPHGDKERPAPAAQRVDWRYIGDRIHDRRKHLDLSKREVVRRVSMSKDMWDDVEDGKLDHLSTETLARIARALHLDPGGFLKRCGREPTEESTRATTGSTAGGSADVDWDLAVGSRSRPGLYVYDRRTRLDMTRGQSARRAGLSKATWTAIEDGKLEPDDATLTKVSCGLYLTAEDLKTVYRHGRHRSKSR
jgi:transcriptional regulator with XRE-family HTH domain